MSSKITHELTNNVTQQYTHKPVDIFLSTHQETDKNIIDQSFSQIHCVSEKNYLVRLENHASRALENRVGGNDLPIRIHSLVLGSEIPSKMGRFIGSVLLH